MTAPYRHPHEAARAPPSAPGARKQRIVAALIVAATFAAASVVLGADPGAGCNVTRAPR
jgi:hypothetical protein